MDSTVAVSVLMGLLLLMGIATENLILPVAYAMMAHHNVADLLTALLDTARKRARLIVMTSITLGASMAFIALGFGANA